MGDFPLDTKTAHHLRTLVLHRIQLQCRQHFTDDFLRQTSLSFLEVAMADAFAGHLQAFCVAIGEEHILLDWPEDWWQAFKLRWFPTFTRWGLFKPVRMNHLDRKVYDAVCPHHHPQTSDHRHLPETHVAWLAGQDGFGGP